VGAWWRLARPAGLWLPPLLPALGYGFAHWDRAVPAWRPAALGWLILAWAALQAGTLWLNAARDRDTGPVLLGHPTPIPHGTVTLGRAALLAAVALALPAGPLPALCAAGCAGLALLYSHPRHPWKAHPVGGPVVNVVGYGLLSPLAGWAILPAPPTARAGLTLGLCALTVLGWTWAAQAFQEAEDKARGDRTLVATHGPRAALGAAWLSTTAVTLGVAVLVVVGWYPRACGVALPALLMGNGLLLRWRARAPGAVEPVRGVIAAGLVGLVLMVGGATAAHLWADHHDRPVAGLGTAAGHPPDRPRLPPSRLLLEDARIRLQTGRPYLRQGEEAARRAPRPAPGPPAR
jgi:1,4-dihydroxy-2-naphthoate octaprenyltransferase